MGTHPTIGYDRFPEQGRDLNKQAMVAFGYQLDTVLPGKVVRDDVEEPFRTIIALEDGRYVLGTECQYRVL